MTETQSLGKSLKSYRVQHGYDTQQQLSNALGNKEWSRGKIGNYESNLNEPPQEFYEALEKLTGESFLDYHSKNQSHLLSQLINSLETSDNLSEYQITLITAIHDEADRLIEENRYLSSRYSRTKRALDTRDIQMSELIRSRDKLKGKLGSKSKS